MEVESLRGALPPFNRTALILTPVENGGWIVSEQASHPGLQSRQLGAFTNAEEMIAALSAALTMQWV